MSSARRSILSRQWQKKSIEVKVGAVDREWTLLDPAYSLVITQVVEHLRERCPARRKLCRV
jgi:hypothetical protein